MDPTPTPVPPTPDPGVAIDAAAVRRKRRLMFGGGALLVLAVVALAGWWFLIRDTSPASVVSAEQDAARDEAIADATENEATTESAVVGLDGTWTIDTSIGTFTDFSSTFAGFRINEELASIGAKTVVGRTPDVSGSIEIEGATITGTDILVDMTTLTTDSGSRDNQLRTQAIETNDFPEATFVLTQPIELGDLPDDGTVVTTTATGDLTIHGVTNSVDIPITAELNSGIIVVVGQINLLLADFSIEQPRSAAVLSVEDNTDLELQLFFTR